MNKEELKELEKSEEKKGFKWTNLEQVFEVINKQQARIDKAKEYIEQEVNNCDIYCDGCTPQHCPDIKKILDILKGNDKE